GGPAFAQAVSAHATRVTSLAVTPTGVLATGDRLVVEVGVWSSTGARISTVSDSAADTFTELTHFQASDRTELSVWTAVIATGGGGPAVTAKPAARADVGLALLDYSGLSAASGTAAVDQMAHATGSAATASAGPTPATTTPGDLAIGLYADS